MLSEFLKEWESQYCFAGLLWYAACGTLRGERMDEWSGTIRRWMRSRGPLRSQRPHEDDEVVVVEEGFASRGCVVVLARPTHGVKSVRGQSTPLSQRRQNTLENLYTFSP